MARFQMELPTEIIKDFEKIHGDSEKIFGGMTQAGAEVARNNVLANMPPKFKEAAASNVRITRVYKTPSDGGINSKVVISGYFINRDGKRTPAPLVANMFEYGSNTRNFPKRPFFRKSFRKGQIEKAMLMAQKELSGGLLDE